MINEQDLNTPWRRVASTIYRKPVDSKIFGQVDLDITELDQFLTSRRKQGLKITYTHIFTLILARCLRDVVPELNCYVKRGKIVNRETVDAMISVLQADGGMSSVRVPNADRLTLSQLVDFLQKDINDSRHGNENSTMTKKDILSTWPWPLRGWLFRLFQFFTLSLGLRIPFLALSPESFGSFVVSNIGSIGLDSGYPALFPASNVATVLVLGGINKKPTVIRDEIVVRKFITISMVIDHRVADASHGGKVARFVKEMIRKPETLL